MKKGKRAKHHHHRVQHLLVQYDHLNAEEREIAMEQDVLAIAAKLDVASAAKIMDKLREKFRSHR